MQKWEYQFVRFDYFAGDLRPQSVNAKDVDEVFKHQSLHEYANSLGDEGWEVVNLNFTPAYGYGFLIFKRPKQE